MLGVRDGSFLDELRSRVPGVSIDRRRKESDIVFYAAEARPALMKLHSLIEAIKRNGAIWVVYPKGRTEITEADVMAAGKQAGLVDTKVVGFSHTHSALKFVIPVARR